jgi:16S rRNA (adenine1518-N6/adenine1519-N6)-dimethyltransferase
LRVTIGVVTHSKPGILALLDQHGLRLSRALGQNFVVDPNTVRRIARMADVGEGDEVVEVGAGLGSLTLALAETGATVTAIELDKRIAPVLASIVEPKGVVVIQGDALEVDWAEIAPGPTTLVANLPYNVGTHIITKVLDEVPNVTRLVVMVQKEVARRLAATVGSPDYGSLSVKIRYHADAKILGTVPPTVFVPKPDVDSAIVELTRLGAPRVDSDFAHLFALVHKAFGKRRKMLRSSLGNSISPQAYERAAISSTMRPEELDVVDWARLLEAQEAQ